MTRYALRLLALICLIASPSVRWSILPLVLSIGSNVKTSQGKHNHFYSHTALLDPLDAIHRRTSITKQTQGTITLANVCLRQPRSTGDIELLSFRSENDTESGGFAIHSHLRKKQDYVLETIPIVNVSEWKELTQSAEWVLSGTVRSGSNTKDHGVVWMYSWQERNNPGHCLNDLSFSAALDLFDSNTTDDVQTIQPFYRHFIHANLTHVHANCDTICCRMFAERFGLIEYEKQIKRISTMDTDERSYAPPLCFERITFPKLEAVRHVYNDNIYQGIRTMRQRSFHMLRDVLDSSPWPSDEDIDGKPSTMLLYDRTDASTRHLVNASVIAAELELRYWVKVDRIGGDMWRDASVAQQAVLYNTHEYIFAPHGAHFVNIMHARPGTKVLEVQCYVNNRRWNLHQQWFSKWAHSIDVDWRVHTEMEGCKENGQILFNYSPRYIHVNVSQIVEAAAQHFGLKARLT